MSKTLRLSKNGRAVHAVRGFGMKCGLVDELVREGTLVWVERGVSFRDATIAEGNDARRLRQLREDDLPPAELRQRHFELPSDPLAPHRVMALAVEARQAVKGNFVYLPEQFAGACA